MTNIAYTPVDIRQLLTRGHDKLRAIKAADGEVLRGVFRAGSAGCLVDGEVYGECHRVAHARALGIETTHSMNREIMFQGGEGNEDLWEKVLAHSWAGTIVRGLKVRRDEDWGSIVGSPDIVLADTTGVRQALLELKLCSAANSSLKRELDGTPDSKHLVQSAAYMWLTGLPAILCYTNRTDFAVEFRRKQYGIAKIDPFYRMFYLTIKNDRLHYRDEFSSTEVPTVVTLTGIENYYRLLSAMQYAQSLLNRPTDQHVNGDAPAYARCNYCTFQSACDRYEDNYRTWLDAITHLVKEG